MGALFSSSSPAPAPVVIPSPPVEDDEAKAREDAVARNRRGLFGTITTSETGLLTPRAGTGKSLLGE